ncbi:hypothetical protein C8Q75DRAFT_796702 [Abortiporus biennis]|nr:hypothetical protein C8Q75DRAFT_796702 [Abortiporus biennis]
MSSKLPIYVKDGLSDEGNRRRRVTLNSKSVFLAFCTLALLSFNLFLVSGNHERSQRIPQNAQEILSQCALLKQTPGPPSNFHARESSDRLEEGTKATLIKNATVWTGLSDGKELVKRADILLEKGIIKGLGSSIEKKHLRILRDNDELVELDVGGAWVTPGIVDLHSHLGVFSTPKLNGAMDVNSPNGPVLPWLRSIDAFNTHDDAFQLAISGGVTTAQVLPGSGNAIGGQAFIVKLRKTSDRSATSMIVEPPYTLNGTTPLPSQPLRWRHLKQACGENLRRYGTRMDALWSFRSAYDEARKIKNAQDAFCTKAEQGLWNELKGESFPDDLKWEMLVDVLRGKVKIANHCYEETDLDDIVRITNEFKFPIASFHHASEAWLVPDVLKRAYGGPPAIAIFASNHRYKRESFRGSEFAPRVLADNGISVVMKSDHPVLNSRYLLSEAQQAHYFSLSPHLALASVTSTPAKAAGMDHRVGYIKEGYDADIVVWDMNPLRVGARPRQVWIDGLAQLGLEDGRLLVSEDKGLRSLPKTPNWDRERDDAKKKGRVVVKDVKEVWSSSESETLSKPGTVIFEDGKIACVGLLKCVWSEKEEGITVVDLKGGVIAPGSFSFGSQLGLQEIQGEPSTGPGTGLDAFDGVPSIVGDETGLEKSVDALKFGTRNALKAHLAGTTLSSISSLLSSPYTLTSTFRTGSLNALEDGAIISDGNALHVTIKRPGTGFRAGGGSVSISAQIKVLRDLLLKGEGVFGDVAKGSLPLIVETGSADIIAAIVRLKRDVEGKLDAKLKLVISGASEAHLVADELAQENIGVILKPSHAFPDSWDERRILAGPPLTNTTSIVTLIKSGVTVGLGVKEGWEASLTRFDAYWAYIDSDNFLTKKQAYDLVSSNLETLLGVWSSTNSVDEDRDWVLYEGGDVFALESKVIGVASGRRRVVELF